MKPLFSGTFPDPMRTGNVSENQPRGAVIRIHPDDHPPFYVPAITSQVSGC